MSRTRSSSASPSSGTTRQRPCAPKCRLDRFRVLPPRPVPVLDDPCRHVRVCQQAADPGTGSVHAGPDLGLDPHDQAAGTSRPRGQPGDLPVQVSLLVIRGHPHIRPIRPDCGSGGRVRRHQHLARLHPDRRDRQRSLTNPPVCRLCVDALHTRPPSQIHPISALTRTHVRSQILTKREQITTLTIAATGPSAGSAGRAVPPARAGRRGSGAIPARAARGYGRSR
jgi:hypothetical protein